MAKVPTVTGYDHAGTANAIYVDNIGVSAALNYINLIDTRSAGQFVTTATPTNAVTGYAILGQWAADTGF
jgi:hypothetical protein